MKTGEEYYTSAIKTLAEYRTRHGNTLMDTYHGLDKDCRFHLAMGYQRIGWNLGCQGRFCSAIMYVSSSCFTFDKSIINSCNHCFFGFWFTLIMIKMCN